MSFYAEIRWYCVRIQRKCFFFLHECVQRCIYCIFIVSTSSFNVSSTSTLSHAAADYKELLPFIREQKSLQSLKRKLESQTKWALEDNIWISSLASKQRGSFLFFQTDTTRIHKNVFYIYTYIFFYLPWSQDAQQLEQPSLLLCLFVLFLFSGLLQIGSFATSSGCRMWELGSGPASSLSVQHDSAWAQDQLIEAGHQIGSVETWWTSAFRSHVREQCHEEH